MSNLSKSLPDLLSEKSATARIAVNSEGEIVHAGSMALKMFGYSNDELLGRRIEVLLPEAIAEKHVAFRARYAANPVDRRMGGNDVLLARRKSGEEFPVEVGLTHGIVDGNPIYLAAVIDISERWARDRELERYREQLEELVEERTQELNAALQKAEANTEFLTSVLGSMNHEFRTPLNAIIGFSEMLEMGYENSSRSEDQERAVFAARIKEAGENLLALIKKATDMSSLGADDMVPRTQQWALVEIIDEAVALVSRELVTNDIRLERSGDFDRQIVTDRVLLTRALALLIENAAKYAGRGAHVQVICAESTSGYLDIRVEDNGPGIATEDRDIVLESFERLGQRTGTISGLGLGLALVRSYVRSLNAELALDTATEGGLAVILKLPVNLTS